ACHSDIKPDNIMKRRSNKWEYFLIDLGSISYEKDSYGYIRNSFTFGYCSQVAFKGQITTNKYDLIELGFTLTWLFCQSKSCPPLGTMPSYKYMYLTDKIDVRIKNYMLYVLKLSETDLGEGVYQILHGK